MKILFSPAHYIFDEYYGGSEPYAAFNIADKIANKNPESVVVTGKKNVLGEKKYKIFEVQREKSGLDMSVIAAIVFVFKYSYKSYRILRQEQFDIIHHIRPFTIGSTFNLLALLGVNKKTPFIIGSFSSPYKKSDQSNADKEITLKDIVSTILYFFLKPFIYTLSVLTMKKADKVIVYDEYTKSLAAKFIDTKKISIIPPGKDKNLYDIKDLKIFDDELIEIISIGSLIFRKAVDVTILAMYEVIKINKNVRFRIVGVGSEQQKLLKMTKELGLNDYIIFEGFVENRYIQNYYKNAHIFVHMAREESHAQVYIEALASGTPIVSAENIASQQILKKGFSYVIPQEDHKLLAEQINYLISNRDILKQFSINSRKYFESKYDWDTIIIPKYIEIYNEVCRKI